MKSALKTVLIRTRFKEFTESFSDGRRGWFEARGGRGERYGSRLSRYLDDHLRQAVEQPAFPLRGGNDDLEDSGIVIHLVPHILLAEGLCDDREDVVACMEQVPFYGEFAARRCIIRCSEQLAVEIYLLPRPNTFIEQAEAAAVRYIDQLDIAGGMNGVYAGIGIIKRFAVLFCTADI